MLVAVALGLVSGCTDETFKDLEEGKYSEYVAFNAEVPSDWTEGIGSRSSSRNGFHTIEIDSTDAKIDGKPLYLVAEITGTDTTSTTVASRGTTVTGDAFHPSVGLSGICYPDAPTTDESDVTTNFAHNLRLSQKAGSGVWEPSEDDRMHWTRSGALRFYAYAPHSSDFGEGCGSAEHSAADHKGVPEITYTASTDVRKQVDLLFATAQCSGDYGKEVELKFSHALTAITFKTGDKMLAGTVKEIKFSNIYMSGSSKIGSDEWTSAGSATGSITVDADKKLDKTSDDNYYTPSGTAVTEGDLTLFMVPQTLPEGAELSITFTDELSGEERTLVHSLAGKTWSAGRKIAYSLSTTGIIIDPVVDYEFESVMPLQKCMEATVVDETKGLTSTSEKIEKAEVVPTSGFIREFRMKAVANVYRAGEEAKTDIELPILGVKYKKEGSEEWADATWTKKTEVARTDAGDYLTGSLKLPATEQFDKMRGAGLESNVNSPVGSEEAPHDLSTKGTANCYMIDRPGWYSFPMYYGNARDDGEQSYKFGGSLTDGGGFTDPSRLVLVEFRNYRNEYVSSTAGKIDDVTDAVLVWQDSPDLVTDVKYDKDKDIVVFNVGKESINQGNAVIAVRDENKTIMWSWHIWVTHHTWGNEELISLKSGVSTDEKSEYKMAPCNLGYCDPHDADKDTKYVIGIEVKLPDGTTDVLVPGDETDSSKEKSVEQVKMQKSSAGDNTYYQWGRKDPMLGGIWKRTPGRSR